MAKAKAEKLSFSKFFPESTAYISVSGKATASDDFSVDVKIGDGNESISLFTTDWYKDDSLAMLKAIQEGIAKAIEFQQKALNLPKGEKTLQPHWALWDDAVVSNGVKEAKQKAAKKTAAKKTAAKK